MSAATSEPFSSHKRRGMEAQGGGCRTNVNKDNNNENGNGRKIETGAGKKRKLLRNAL